MLTVPRIGRWLSAVLPIFLSVQTLSQPVASPNINIDGLGQIAIAGNFDAAALYEYVGQKQGYHGNGTQSVLSTLPSGLLNVLASSDASIQAMCPFVLRNGTYLGLVVGGNFTSLGGVDARSAALINTDTYRVYPNPGIEGSIHTVYCDRNTSTVYVGGNFEAITSSNAVAWMADGSWSELSFAGFDGPIYSITGAPDGHVIFGGAFNGLKNSTAGGSNTTNQDQVVNVGGAFITSEGNTTSGQGVVCPPGGSGSPWLLQDNTAGYWQATFRYGFEPSRLRLWNANQNGRGVKTFRFTALPINGILNLTYIDEQGNRAYCDSTCPLPNRAQYQDFEFVNVVGLNSFRLDVSDWYGSGGGLAGVEIFQKDIFVYAVDSTYQNPCASETVSTASTTGAWYETPSGQSNSDYLTVVTGPTTVGSTEIVFEPDITRDGNYTVIVYTPGCRGDSSCSARAIVNVSATLTQNAGTSFSSQVYQTNDYDKYDPVWSGRIEARTGSFRPRVTLRPSGFQTDQLVVASKIRFALTNTTGGLNGIFDFNPSQATVDPDFSKSAINSAGNVLRPNAQVNALAVHNDAIYVGGKFEDDTFTNIMYFQDNRADSLPNGGLNADVSSLYSDGQFLYVGGNFTGANNNGPVGLANVAAYNYASNSWVALGAGLDGSVADIVPLVMNNGSSNETVITFNGEFRNVLTSDSRQIAANGFAIWVPSRKTWLNTLDTPRQLYQGQLSTAAFLPNGTWLAAGTLTSLGEALNNVVSLEPASGNKVRLQQLPLNIQSSSSSRSNSSVTKRDVISGRNVTGVVIAIFDTTNNRNLTIVGGQFSATGANRSSIENLLIFDGNTNTATGLPAGISNNSTFTSLAVQGNILIAGGSVTGQVNNAQIDGIVMYDLAARAYRPVQPAALAGPEVVVNSIAPQPSSSSVYVGGSFDATSGQLSCRSVCAYDLNTNQWSTVGGQLSGNVTALYWISNTELLAAGDMSVSGNNTVLARYNVQQASWSAQSSSAIPGGITAFTAGTRNADHIWVAGTANNGSAYLMEVDGNNFRPVSSGLEPGTSIRGLKLIYLTQDHGDSQYLDRDQALMVSGQLNLTDYGPTSVALFNGSTFTPLIFSSTADGSPGIVNGFFSEKADNPRPSGFRHSRGIAVLVALCAALGTIFLIVLIGIIANKIQQRRNGYNTVPSVPYADKNTNLGRVPPESLFGSLGQKNPGAPTV